MRLATHEYLLATCIEGIRDATLLASKVCWITPLFLSPDGLVVLSSEAVKLAEKLLLLRFALHTNSVVAPRSKPVDILRSGDFDTASGSATIECSLEKVKCQGDVTSGLSVL